MRGDGQPRFQGAPADVRDSHAQRKQGLTEGAQLAMDLVAHAARNQRRGGHQRQQTDRNAENLEADRAKQSRYSSPPTPTKSLSLQARREHIW